MPRPGPDRPRGEASQGAPRVTRAKTWPGSLCRARRAPHFHQNCGVNRITTEKKGQPDHAQEIVTGMSRAASFVSV
jgi:hypothetical protein